jgi:DNA-binding LacI/PurR family transcriptional regulator
MQDIAQQVGVSKMAVSAVLGKTTSHSRVSEATRQRILEVAQQLEYRPNALARSLRSRQTNLIGFYSGYAFIDPRNAFLAAIVAGLQEECGAHRKDLLLHTTFRGDSSDDVYAELADGRIDGLVMTAPPEHSLAERLAASHLPVVAISDAIPALPSVVVDDTGGALLTLDYLAARGHRRILLRTAWTRLVSAERRRAAYLQGGAERGMQVTEWHPPHPLNPEDPLPDGWEHRPRGERPTAAVCWNDVAAYDLLAHCQRRGVDVPADLAITGFDGDRNPLESRFRLTTIRAPWAEVARVAVRLLLAQFNGEEVPMETVLPVELAPGDSA